GWEPVTVPGQIRGWSALHGRFGKLPFKDLLQPAITYAREGWPVPPTVADMWAGDFVKHSAYEGEIYKEWFNAFAPKGRAPVTGEMFACEDMAKTLEDIAETGGETVYTGALADKIDAYSRATGGYIRKSDLAAYQPQWVQPVEIDYKGYKVLELPPNCSGMVAQMALNILKGMELGDREDPLTVHRQIEAMKMAFADGMAAIAEPSSMKVSVDALLSEQHAARRRAMITHRAQQPAPVDPNCNGTVYLCAADEQGNMVSYIQSNYLGFGSGIVIPGTAFGLQNRGNNFSLDEGEPNCIAGGKRAYHTILPAFLCHGDGRPIGPFGVMGAFMQPQGHVQVVMNTVDWHMNPQDALNAPRWQWTGGMTIEVEPTFPEHVAKALAEMGHHIVRAQDSMSFGRGQIIWREDNGVYAGATEPRTDGTVAVW
ncbi:MAG: gamma-glutamyltransferase family protein, partial [Christensenellaceae bacterium]|nr:gamma-glutamyltransferase family protein [Christensenellaceae bacterium]